jgi:hypothetical protein
LILKVSDEKAKANSERTALHLALKEGNCAMIE